MLVGQSRDRRGKPDGAEEGIVGRRVAGQSYDRRGKPDGAADRRSTVAPEDPRRSGNFRTAGSTGSSSLFTMLGRAEPEKRNPYWACFYDTMLLATVPEIPG